jgi:hypothetical protein
VVGSGRKMRWLGQARVEHKEGMELISGPHMSVVGERKQHGRKA